MQISAVCISREPQEWRVSEIPFYNYTAGWKPFQHEKTKQRVDYLAERRNAAVSKTLELIPKTQNVLMIDSYYTHQEQQIRALVQEYTKMTLSTYPKGCILGASTWIHDVTRMRARFRFYDGWTTPEGVKLRLDDVERTGGIMKVGAVGGCYLYPRWVWEKTGYNTPEDLHGCEHNWLCEQSRLPVFLTLNERLWREPIMYPWVKRMRMSLHLGRFVRR
jgi:hypothetical protein